MKVELTKKAILVLSGSKVISYSAGEQEILMTKNGY
jgi:hypothetical protein